LYPWWHLVNRPIAERFIGAWDVVHILSGSARFPCRAPLAVTIHDLASERLPHSYPWRRRVFKRRLLKDLGPRGAHVLAVSKATRRDLLELTGVPPERITVTYEAVDTDVFRMQTEDRIREVRDRYRLPPRYFVFLGARSPRKNVDLLFRGFDAFARASRNTVHLVMAGAPLHWKDGAVHRQWEQLEAKEAVHFTGYVSDEDLPALYGGAVALVYPSRYEGFGLPLLEAMACGAPVIATNTASIPEVAGDAARLVGPEDAAALAQALNDLAHDDGARAELVRRGLDRVGRFSWESTAQKTLTVYEAIAKQ
jgi:glycosyltransferase involved in cell wall biosynthesis